MYAKDIKAKIEKTEETIAKKNALVEKRFKAIEKHISGMKKAVAGLGGCIEFEFTDDVEEIDGQNTDAEKYIREMGCKNGEWDNEWYSVLWDYHYKICDCLESIENARRDIKEKERTLATYRERLAEEEDREAIFETMPDCMKDFMAHAIESWTAWDKYRRESVKVAHEEDNKLYNQYYSAKREHGRDSEEAKEINREIRALREQFSQFEWNELAYMTDDAIRERNVKAGKALVMDLYNRVNAIVGTFEDASDLKMTVGNNGFAVINGLVRGNGRTAKVQSVGAGGWNIQRFHIRTLVHEVA